MEEISRGIYLENTYSGVTLGAVLLPQGTILLDAPLRAEESRVWRAMLNNLGANPNRILVNLDAHPDRTLGARALDCTIVAHQKTAQVFRTRPSVFKGQNADSGSEWEAYDEAVGTRWAVPDITFSHHLHIHWGPYPVRLEHHSGPMPGAIWVVYPEAKAVFVGDAVLENQPPFLAQANLDEWLEALNLLSEEYKGFSIISGRGGLIQFDAVRAQKRHLKRIQKEIEKNARYHPDAERIETMIVSILKGFDYPPQLEDLFLQRLRHGLSHYYTHHFEILEKNEIDQ